MHEFQAVSKSALANTAKLDLAHSGTTGYKAPDSISPVDLTFKRHLTVGSKLDEMSAGECIKVIEEETKQDRSVQSLNAHDPEAMA